MLPRPDKCRFSKIRIELEQRFNAGTKTSGNVKKRFLNLSGEDRTYENFGAIRVGLNVAHVLQHRRSRRVAGICLPKRG
jgi:hypothetical protein